MEEPLPAPPESRRASVLKRPTVDGDRIPSIVPDDAGPGKPAAVSEERVVKPLEQRMASLATALRRARIENAEQSAALADLRAAEIVRLEMLSDALAPVLAQTPDDCDIFDVAISPGERPRLFIDQIGFVEMDRDRRTYRFLQDTRHGRITLRESADIDEIVDAATNYIAHRLIERDKALAIDYASGGAARVVREKTKAAAAAAAAAAPPATSTAFSGKAFQAFLFFIEFLGSAAFFGFLAIIAVWAYRTYIAA